MDRAQEALGIGDPAHAATLVGEALALWRGEIVLGDLGPPDFAVAAVARLGELRVVAEETAMAAALALGRHREVVGRLQELVAAHPFHERLCGQLVLALYRSGRQVDALAAYTETKQRLGDELGIDPGPELQALETAVLRQDPALLPPIDVHRPGHHRRARTQRRRAPLSRRNPPTPSSRRSGDRPWSAGTPGSRRRSGPGRRRATAGAGCSRCSGPAGVGKSRLVAELAHLATQDGATVLVGRCDATAPYAVLASALGDSAAARQLAAGAPAGVRARLHPLLPLDPDAGIEPLGAGDADQRRGPGPRRRAAARRTGRGGPAAPRRGGRRAAHRGGVAAARRASRPGSPSGPWSPSASATLPAAATLRSPTCWGAAGSTS